MYTSLETGVIILTRDFAGHPANPTLAKSPVPTLLRARMFGQGFLAN